MNIPDGQLSPLLKLHEDGHDLWFLYDRSSEYARHETLSNEDQAYWDFTEDTIANYDIKDALDFVYTATG